MKYAKIGWMLGLALVVGAACGDAPATESATRATEQMAADSAGAVGSVTAEASVVYVDVRTPEEYAAGHVDGAIHIPHTEMAQRYPELEQYGDREIVLYCRSGRRSGIAKGILEEAGFDNVTNGGGLADLQAEGVPTTR